MLLTTQKLQDRLGISRSVAYRLMRSQSFPSMRIGGRYYVDETKVIEWIEKNKYKSISL